MKSEGRSDSVKSESSRRVVTLGRGSAEERARNARGEHFESAGLPRLLR